VKLIVFDFDGLILDTEVPVYEAWQELYAEHGQALPFEKWAQCIGTADIFDPCLDLAERVGRILDAPALRRRHGARTNALIADQRVRPGVVERLEEARAMGLTLAVASSSDRDWVETHLERLGLRDRFHTVRCAEDVLRVKPDPALYRAVLEATGVRAADAVALEDSPNGVLAAKRAGLTCVAVPNALTARLDLGAADLRLASLADMPLAALLARLRPPPSRHPDGRLARDPG
jgi:HAD superfamily hydrolase (TIGR01509 family)